MKTSKDNDKKKHMKLTSLERSIYSVKLPLKVKLRLLLDKC